MASAAEKVQVCLPVYNGARFVTDTIKSLLQQTHLNLEVLVLDDASTDNTYEILLDLAKHDRRIVLYRNEENRGILYSRNHLYTLASARFIALADADDIFANNRIEDQLTYLLEHNLGMVSCAYSAFGEREFDFYPPEKHDEIHATMLLYNVILNPGVMLDREKVSLDDIKVDSAYRGAADYDCWLRLLDKTRVGCLPQKLVRYRIHAEQESSDNFARQQNAHLRILAREYGAIGFPYNKEALKVLIWPHLYGDTLDHRMLKNVGKFAHSLLKEIEQSQLPAKKSLSFAIDIRYKGISRRYAIKGLFLYLRFAGFKRLIAGHNLGMNFVHDCLFRK